MINKGVSIPGQDTKALHDDVETSVHATSSPSDCEVGRNGDKPVSLPQLRWVRPIPSLTSTPRQAASQTWPRVLGKCPLVTSRAALHLPSITHTNEKGSDVEQTD